jgi:hypothetical protein
MKLFADSPRVIMKKKIREFIAKFIALSCLNLSLKL